MYDTIIVFDRIRENVPRMPRAAFSQIVNRSISQVHTRSLITGLSTVFLVTMLLIFGDETLRGFAFAMMVGIASGTYSSIFIAAPVLTEWKEREATYRARRHHIEETMGYVPVFPEDNVVARVEGHGGDDQGERVLIGGGPPVATEVPADASDASPPTGAPETRPLTSDAPERSEAVTGPPGAAETDGAGGAGDQAEPVVAERSAAERERRRQRQKRRKKHGRNR
jgi:SecD/SecF fusion protein